MFKYAAASGTCRSMRVALQDFGLDRLLVVYPGHRRYRLDESIVVVPLEEAAEVATGWRPDWSGRA